MELIRIQRHVIGSETVNAVDARELWFFLESKQEFSAWIKARIERYGFVENMDYGVFDNLIKNPLGGRPTTTYVVTLDMAKELSMVEHTDKGRQARKWFLDCERRANNVPDLSDTLNDPHSLRNLLLGYSEKVIVLEEKVAAQAPKVAAFETISASDGSFCITDGAKSLNYPPRKLFAWLRENRWIYRRTGCSYDVPYQERIQQGYMEMKVTTIHKPDGDDKTVEQARITSKGLAKLAILLGTTTTDPTPDAP